MKIIVTGGKGQLANCIKDNVFFNDEFKSYEYVYIDYEDLDITDFNAVVSYFSRFDDIYAVINCAAYTNVNKAEEDIDLARKVNAIGPKYLSEVCKSKNIRFIQISTDFVFDNSYNSPIEVYEDNLNSLNMYGKTKAEGEELIKEVFGGDNNYCIIRTAWLYSEHGKNFCKTILDRVVNNKECKVVVDQVGTPTYAQDLAYFILKYIIPANSNKLGNTLHFTNEGVASWYDFAKAIELAYNDIKNTEHTNIVKPRYTTSEEKYICRRPNYSVLSKYSLTRVCGDDYTSNNWIVSVNKCVTNLLKKGEN